MAENPRIEELRRRVQADPASIAFAGLAEEFRRVGRYDDAIATCRTGLQRHPAYLSARVTLGRALIETGDLDAAREELETVLLTAPDNLAAIRGLAQIHEKLGQSSEMDPHLADMMNTMHAESLRVAAQPPPAPPAPELAFQPESLLSIAPEPEPVLSLAPQPEPEPAPSPVEGPVFEAAPMAASELQIEPEPEPEPVKTFEPVEKFEPIEEFESIEEFEPVEKFEPIEEFEPEPAPAALQMAAEPAPPALSFVEGSPVEGPDPALLATLARLERFLGAIQSLRA